MTAPFLACDWGTTQVRAWRVEADGQVGASEIFPLGVSRLRTGEAAARFRDEVRPALGAEGLPAILCGMIGSNLGWTPVPYLDCPADPAALGRALYPAPGDADAWIVPGLRGPGLTRAPDVMRGEETQLVGWLTGDPARSRGRHVVCLPGTHAKWVLIEDGRFVRFVTAMTGELFDILSRYSVLKSDTAAEDEAAFLEGVDAAGDGGGLSARLFSARSRVVGGGAPSTGTASYLSGLLIGAEIAGVAPMLNIQETGPIVLIGERALCALYERVLGRVGGSALPEDGRQATLAGLGALIARSSRP